MPPSSFGTVGGLLFFFYPPVGFRLGSIPRVADMAKKAEVIMSSRLPPEGEFPDDLEVLADETVEIINSKLHRQNEYEYREGYSQPETEFRLEEVRLELDARDAEENKVLPLEA